MRSFTSLLGPAHRGLAERLSRLRRSFGTLGEEVRGSVARLVAHAVAEAVQAAVQTLLGGSDGPAYTPTLVPDLLNLVPLRLSHRRVDPTPLASSAAGYMA